MTRHEERIQIFTLLYEYTFYDGADADEFISSREVLNEAEYSQFIKASFCGAVKCADEIDEVISRHAVGWKIKRMSKVTLSVLRLAVYELKYTDTPPKAVINEAVEIAKEYDDEKAAPFVNGILNKVARTEGLIADPDNKDG